jgi:peptidyl-prolyl cis-trans isomerase D
VISKMREYFRSLKFLLLIVIVAFIVTSVVYFGGGSRTDGGDPRVVATVNGEEIPVERFRRMQANAVQAYEQLTRQRLTPEMAERLGLNQQVIRDLVTDAVVVQAAEREGIRVPDAELRARIQEMREFQEDGAFSRDRYLRVLRQARLDPGEFESELRRQLLRRKIETLVKDGAKVSEEELRQAYASRADRVRAAWASLDTAPLVAQVKVPDAELEPYVKAHQAQFTRPERRRLQYVVLTPRQFAQPVGDAEAEAYYKERAAEFETPRRVRVAHVLVRVPPVGGSEAENRSRAKVEDVIRRARAGEDFAKLAREISEDTANAAQGGDLGFVGPGELVPQFEQPAFALKKGEVSPAPVRTPFGYHAIKVLDIQEGGRTPFKEAAARIKEKLGVQRSDAAARKRADEVRAPLQAAKDFAAEARTLGLTPRDTLYSRGVTLDGVGRDPRLDESIWALAVGGVSSPVKTAGGYVIVKVEGQLPAGVPPLADIKDQVMEAIKRERGEALATDRAQALVATLEKGGDFAATARADGFTTGEVGFFSRNEPPKERGTLPGPVLLAALQTAVGQYSRPVKTGSAVWVVRPLERQPADPRGFATQRADLEKQLLEQKRTQLWEAWIQARRAASKIHLTGQAVAAR